MEKKSDKATSLLANVIYRSEAKHQEVFETIFLKTDSLLRVLGNVFVVSIIKSCAFN